MKKILAPLAGIAILSFGLILSCNKKNTGNEVTATQKTYLPVQTLTTGKPLQFANTSGRFAPDDIGELPGGGGCTCAGHGGSAGGTLSWILATCRSNCSRGIGFRCGREGILICQDGSVIACIWGSNCPNANRASAPERQMNASYELFENGTMKLTFKKPVPDVEKNSSAGDVLEVEQSDYVKFNAPVLANGENCTGFDILQGNYHINYEDGQYGSVVIGIKLK